MRGTRIASIVDELEVGDIDNFCSRVYGENTTNWLRLKAKLYAIKLYMVSEHDFNHFMLGIGVDHHRSEGLKTIDEVN